MTEKIAEIPEDIPHLFVKAWNTRRADEIAALFEEDADFVNVVGMWWESKTDIYAAHEYGLRVIFKDSELRLGKVKVKFLGSDHVVVHARMRLSGQTSHGIAAGVRQNLFIFVARQHGDRWLCVSAQNTDIVPGAETHIRNEDDKLVPLDYRTK